MIDFLKNLQFKNDIKLWLLAVVLAIGAYFSVQNGWATWGEAKAFLLAAFALPGFFGLKSVVESKNDDDEGGKGPPSSVYRIPSPPPKDEPPSPPSPPAAARSIFMRPLLMIIGLYVVAFSAMVALAGCSWFTPERVRDAKDVTRTTLTVLEKACIIANAAFPRSEVAKACGIAGPLVDLIDEELLSAKAAGVTPARAYLVTCDQGDDGVIRCEKPFVESTDAGLQ